MDPVHVFGIDPGLVHTGVVQLSFYPQRHYLRRAVSVVAGTQVSAVANWVGPPAPRKHVFIEGYKPRSHYDTDNRMVAAVAAIHKEIKGSKVLLNHGAKKIVRKPLMDLLEVYSFTTVTHHQDLRAAARIALFGMLKDEELNAVLTQVVEDYLAGRRWDVLV